MAQAGSNEHLIEFTVMEENYKEVKGVKEYLE